MAKSKQKRDRLRDEYADATKAALIEAGRKAFAKAGYGGTSIETIVSAARVTRGALYHHFRDKRALFEAVLVSLQERVTSEVAAEAPEGTDFSWELLVHGVNKYLNCCLVTDYRRIVILDGPSVLGALRWRQIDHEHPIGLLSSVMAVLAEQGIVDTPSTEVAASLIGATITEAALLIAEADNTDTTRAKVWPTVVKSMEAFKAAA